MVHSFNNYCLQFVSPGFVPSACAPSSRLETWLNSQGRRVVPPGRPGTSPSLHYNRHHPCTRRTSILSYPACLAPYSRTRVVLITSAIPFRPLARRRTRRHFRLLLRSHLRSEPRIVQRFRRCRVREQRFYRDRLWRVVEFGLGGSRGVDQAWSSGLGLPTSPPAPHDSHDSRAGVLTSMLLY
jgi:hypothetical protein